MKKLCINCEYLFKKQIFDVVHYYCRHEKIKEKISPVTGEPSYAEMPADFCRISGCGPDADWFTIKVKDAHQREVERFGDEFMMTRSHYQKPKPITKLAFMNRFTVQELDSIYKSTDETVRYVLRIFDMKVSGLPIVHPSVDLCAKETRDFANHLVSLGILTELRVTEILETKPKAHELYG